MKTNKTLVVSALMGFALCVLSAPFVAKVIAADYTGPREVRTNYKQAKTDYNLIAFYDSNEREWLRVQGNDKAATIATQWGPQYVSIETTREPQIAQTPTGWIIVFKP
jgi:hypothetical protein